MGEARPMAAAPEVELEWKECFDLFDAKSEGKIQAKELGEALRSLGQILTNKEVQELENEVRLPTVSWDKFKEIAGRRKGKELEKQMETLLKAFQVFDTGGIGKVDMEELKHVLT